MTGSDPVALFTCASSPYLWLGVECYDLARNALTFDGPNRVICHPPCRTWGRFKAVAKGLAGERELALWAMDLVRRNGGVLEHPASSGLWKHLLPGDSTITVPQCDWGHRAQKMTTLFYAGLGPMPPRPHPYVGRLVPVELMGRHERERTPAAFAEWLVTWCRS